jgi:alkaline phosphatase
MTYVDGFVIPVKKSNVKKYVKMAQWGKRVWMKHGALQYFECKGDDLKVMHGTLGFTKMAKLKQGETVFFSFIVYKNKAHRNKVNKAVMKEMEKDTSWTPDMMPHDPKRMAYGGFKTLVQG